MNFTICEGYNVMTSKQKKNLIFIYKYNMQNLIDLKM
jgi:hypothetical protein